MLKLLETANSRITRVLLVKSDRYYLESGLNKTEYRLDIMLHCDSHAYSVEVEYEGDYFAVCNHFEHRSHKQLFDLNKTVFDEILNVAHMFALFDGITVESYEPDDGAEFVIKERGRTLLG